MGVKRSTYLAIHGSQNREIPRFMVVTDPGTRSARMTCMTDLDMSNPASLALAIYLGNAPESIKLAAIEACYAPLATLVASLLDSAGEASTVCVVSSFPSYVD